MKNLAEQIKTLNAMNLLDEEVLEIANSIHKSSNPTSEQLYIISKCMTKNSSSLEVIKKFSKFINMHHDFILNDNSVTTEFEQLKIENKRQTNELKIN